MLPLKNVVFFYHIVKPLHITDPDQSLTLHRSLSENIPLAICYVPEGSDTFNEVAGFGMPQIIEHRLDGSYLIFIKCLGKIKIDLSSVQVENASLQAEAFLLQENTELGEHLKSHYISLSHVLARWIQRHIPDIHQQKSFLNSLTTPLEVISAFASYLVYDYDMQYEILCLESLDEKIEILYRLLESGRLLNA